MTGKTRLVYLLLLYCSAVSSIAQESYIPASLIIDDLGYSADKGQRALALNAAVTYSILPATPHARELAEQAATRNKEVILHLPMQGSHGHMNEPGSLTHNMPEPLFRSTVRKYIDSLPNIVGVNNHMGSLITPLNPQMEWLMHELSQHSLYFVDSRTTHLTVAPDAADKFAVPFSQRDVFLDNQQDSAAIKAAFERFIKLTKRRNGAIAIAHPHTITLNTLEKLLPTLAQHGIKLVPVSELIRYQKQHNKAHLAQRLSPYYQ